MVWQELPQKWIYSKKAFLLFFKIEFDSDARLYQRKSSSIDEIADTKMTTGNKKSYFLAKGVFMVRCMITTHSNLILSGKYDAKVKQVFHDVWW